MPKFEQKSSSSEDGQEKEKKETAKMQKDIAGLEEAMAEQPERKKKYVNLLKAALALAGVEGIEAVSAGAQDFSQEELSPPAIHKAVDRESLTMPPMPEVKETSETKEEDHRLDTPTEIYKWMLRERGVRSIDGTSCNRIREQIRQGYALYPEDNTIPTLLVLKKYAENGTREFYVFNYETGEGTTTESLETQSSDPPEDKHDKKIDHEKKQRLNSKIFLIYEGILKIDEKLKAGEEPGGDLKKVQDREIDLTDEEQEMAKESLDELMEGHEGVDEDEDHDYSSLTRALAYAEVLEDDEAIDLLHEKGQKYKERYESDLADYDLEDPDLNSYNLLGIVLEYSDYEHWMEELGEEPSQEVQDKVEQAKEAYNDLYEEEVAG